MEKKKLHYGFIIVAAIFIDVLVCGGIFFGASGVFIVPVTTSLGIGLGEFSMYLTIQSISMAVTMLIAPKLLAKYKYKKLNAISAVLSGCGFALMGLAKNVMLLYIAGVLIGFSCVFLTYLISGTLLPHWFSQKLGTMIAFVMSGLGIGGIIFNPVASALINTSGLLGFDEGWRSAYILLGALVVVICLPIALFVLEDYPADKGLLPFGSEVSEEAGRAGKISGVSKSIAVKSGSFVWYVVAVLAFALPSAIMTYLPALAANAPASTANFDLTGIIGSVGMLGAMLGGFLIGAVNDKFGAQAGCLAGGAFGVLGFIILLMGGGSAFMLLAGAAFYGVFYQINQVQMPAMVRTMYGDREYDKIFPVCAAFTPWVGAVAYSLWGFIYDASGSYNTMLIIGIALGALTVVAGLLAVACSKKLPRETVEVENV